MPDKMLKKAYSMAVKLQKRAYAPYSHYKVGASLWSGNKLYGGCNVENASYGGTICAERSAVLRAVSEGVQKFEGAVVVTKNGATPCALCLQIFSEFCGPEFRIAFGTPSKLLGEVKLSQLLGFPFRRSDLKRRFHSAFHLRA